MKIAIDSGEYTPTHCSECSKPSRITVYFTNHVWLCLECIRKASSLLENAVIDDAWQKKRAKQKRLAADRNSA